MSETGNHDDVYHSLVPPFPRSLSLVPFPAFALGRMTTVRQMCEKCTARQDEARQIEMALGDHTPQLC